MLVHAWTIWPEEMLEMTGSALWLLAALLALEAVDGRPPSLSLRRLSRRAG